VILLEFAAQGVRGVAPSGGRATLRPGYNVVAGDGAVLRRLFDALLYPEIPDPEPIPRAAGGPPGAALRAGLTLVGNDRITYRLLRDFAAGIQLHRFDAEKRSFALVAQEPGEIAEVLQTAAGIPERGRYAALLCLSAAELPSKAGGGGLGGATAAAPPARPALSADQAKRKIAELQGELQKAKVSEKLSYQQDGLQSRVFKLDEALKAGVKLKEGLAKAEEDRAALDPAVAALGQLGDVDARIAAYEKATARKDEALARVEAERAAIQESEERGAPAPFWKEARFLGGAGGGAALLAAGVAGAAQGSGLRYAALLAIPAFGWGAWQGLAWVSATETFEKGTRRRRVVDDWERKMLDQFEKDGAGLRAAMKALGVEKVADLKDLAARIQDADRVVGEWKRRIEEWQADPDVADAREQKAKAEKELREIEERMQDEVGGFVRDVRSIEAEIQRLEGELANPAPPPAAAKPAPATPARPAGDPLRLLLEGAAAELGGSPAAAARTIQQKASSLLTGVTFQRIGGVSVDDRGNVQGIVGGRPVPAATLPAADRDLLFLSLKLGFMEAAIAQGKAIAFVDDCFGGLSDGAKRLVARFLKAAAKPGQIVHASADGAFREAADHSA
jgi:hypothetical protein